MDDIFADLDLGERECLLVFLTGILTASAVEVKRAKRNKRTGKFISKGTRRERNKE